MWAGRVTPRQGRRGRTPLRLDIVVGFAVAALVFVGGVAFRTTRPSRWSATASILVLPKRDLAPETQAGYYQTLGQSRMVGSLAEVLRRSPLHDKAASRIMLPESARRLIAVHVVVIPETAVISLRVTARRSEHAEQFADALVEVAKMYSESLEQPYRLEVVSPAVDTAEMTGPPGSSFIIVVLLVAIGLGIAMQQAARQLGPGRGPVLTPSEEP